VKVVPWPPESGRKSRRPSLAQARPRSAAQPTPPLCGGLCAAIESLEDVREFVWRDARAGVGHRDRDVRPS